MKKLLLSLLLLLPLLASAQTEPVIIHDFYENCKSLVNTFYLNDDVQIMQVNTDNDNFDMLAINDQMKVLWKITLPGHAMSSGKFKDKIVAIATTDYSSLSKTTNNEYKGYLIDPANGKILIDKIIYSGGDDKVERPRIYFGPGGSYFRMSILKTALANRMHVGLPGPLALITLAKVSKQATTMTGFLAMEFDMDLNVSQLIDPKLPEGNIFSYWFSGDQLYIKHANNGQTLEYTAYNMKGNEPVAHHQVSFNTHKKFTAGQLAGGVLMAYSSQPNIIYFGLIHPNEEKDIKLTLTKLDITTGKTQSVTEDINKDRIKQVEKAFIPVNPKIKNPDIGSPSDLDLVYMREIEGKLVVSMAGSKSYVSPSGISSTSAYAPLIAAYDLNLKPLYQQTIPVECVHKYSLGGTFIVNGRKLISIRNASNGPNKINGLYSVLDVETGKFDKMEWLINKKVDRDDYLSTGNIMMFKKYYIIPYLSPKGLMRNKYELTLFQHPLQ